MKPLMQPVLSKRQPAKHYRLRRCSRYQDQSLTFMSLSVCPVQAYHTAARDSPRRRQMLASMQITDNLRDSTDRHYQHPGDPAVWAIALSASDPPAFSAHIPSAEHEALKSNRPVEPAPTTDAQAYPDAAKTIQQTHSDHNKQTQNRDLNFANSSWPRLKTI